MTKQRMIFEAVETLYDSEDRGDVEPEILRRRIRIACEKAWQDGMSLEGLIDAARRKLASS